MLLIRAIKSIQVAVETQECRELPFFLLLLKKDKIHGVIFIDSVLQDIRFSITYPEASVRNATASIELSIPKASAKKPVRIAPIA
jgi:hypothetical protein